MRNLFILSFFVFACHSSFGQHQADKWFFGMNAGLDFISGSPVAVSGALQTTEGCSAVSDEAGNLLFYTDGVTVWNNNHEVMPNGTGLFGGVSTTQSALIVPAPGSSDDYYYIFTLDEFGGPNGLSYSIVNMTLDSGSGDVITKNVLIQNDVTERIAALKQPNGLDYWIVVHEWGSDAFYTYSLTSAGLQSPVISNTGIIHSTTQIQNTYGQMKFSTCNDKLAVAAGYQDTIQVFDFDPTTGIVSNPITIPAADHVYGLEFSPDGSELYVTCYDTWGTLLQYDINGNNQYNIILSKITLSVTPDLYALQIGPDGKIYVCKSWSSTLGVINFPDVHGYSCDFNESAVNLDPNYQGITSALGLPEFAQNFFITENSCLATMVNPISSSGKFFLSPNPAAEAFNLSTGGFTAPLAITVCDSEGRLIVETENFNGQTFSFGEDLKPGIYFVTIKNLKEIHFLKAIKTY